MRSIPQLLWMLVRTLFMGFRHKRSMATLRSTSARLAALNSALEAYRRGDYEASLRAAEGLKDGGRSTPEYYFYRGANLMYLGRFDEAERSMRENIAIEEDSRTLALSYSTLGQLLIERRRYDEAMGCLETSLRYWPARGSTHRDMAEACLRSGGPSAQAFEWATLAVREEQAREAKSAEQQEAYNLNLGENLATLAWAVAVHSRDEIEVDRLVAEAVSLVGRGLVGHGSATSSAQVHHEAGLAYTALGNAAKSGPHFEEAARADPNGLWGRAAQTMRAGVSQ